MWLLIIFDKDIGSEIVPSFRATHDDCIASSFWSAAISITAIQEERGHFATVSAINRIVERWEELNIIKT